MSVSTPTTIRPKRVHLRALLRLRELAEEIARRRYPTCADLAGKLERSVRTIRRDIQSLLSVRSMGTDPISSL